MGFWEGLLQKLHEFWEHLFVHFVSDLSPERALLVELFKGVFFGILILVEINIDSWTFDCGFLSEFCLLEIVILNFFSFSHRTVV
jgi:hypothetical protein